MVAEFGRLGHAVAGCARSADAVRRLQEQQKDSGVFDQVDVADDGQVAAWAKKIVESIGVPDLLINNAAIINRNAPLWRVSAEEFSRVIDINIKGTVNMIRHFVPAMMQKKGAVIVNISSGWGRSTDAEVAPYCATKWAIEGLTQALAQELPQGMAAVALNPGVINTEMLQSCFGDSAASYPSAEQWARKAVPFLLQIGPQQNGQPLSAPA